MYFVFSDVHGCLNEMNELLKYWNPEKEQLIFLGDMIDRGYDSFGVIKRLMELKYKYGDRVIILRGNHEDEFIYWMNLPPVEKSMLYYPGLHETLRSFYRDDMKQFKKDTRRQRAIYVKKKYPDVIKFLSELPYYYETESCIFVHAGIDLNNPEWRKDHQTLIWIRDEYLFSEIKSQKRIFSGHTPTRFLHNSDDIWISEMGDKVVIDGECVFGGQLNGVRVNECGEIKEIISIEYKN